MNGTAVKQQDRPVGGQGSATRDEKRGAGGDRLRGILARYALVFSLFALVILFSVFGPSTFATTTMFISIASTVAVLLILSLGLLLPLAAGDFDLSVAATLGISSGVLAICLSNFGLPLALAIAVTILVAVLIGAVNGFLVVGLGINAFIATLGIGTVLGGLTLAILDSQTLFVNSAPLQDLTRTKLLGLPLPVFYSFALAALVWYVLAHTPAGRYVYMTGEGRAAAALSGVPVGRIRFFAFVGASVFAAIAGMVVVGVLGAANPSTGPGFLLPAYAATFLGATAISVGRFNVVGTVVAVYFVEVGISGFEVSGAASWVTEVFNGGVLVLAVGLASVMGRRQR